MNNIIDLPELADRTAVFRDRAHAGRVLAEMLGKFKGTNAIVLGIASGGLPVGAEIALGLGLELDVAVVSKITPRWNSEIGFGAVAFDGTVRLSEDFISDMAMPQEEIDEGIQRTRRKVQDRMHSLRGGRSMPVLTGRTTIVTDDGVASGITMLATVDALRRVGAGEIVMAVPTGPYDSVHRLAREVNTVYCPNIRSGPTFAVADAYERWFDLPKQEAARILAECRNRQTGK